MICSEYALGVVDPRPVTMSIVCDVFDRILSNGGIFIIFAAEKEFVHARVLKGTSDVRESDLDNWGFLSLVDGVQLVIRKFQGNEVLVDEMRKTWLARLARYVERATIDCTFLTYLGERWQALAKNKFGDDVAGVILPNERNRGLIFIFPNIENKSEFLVEMLTTILPDVSPQLFPFFEGQRWLMDDVYELPRVVELKQEISTVTAEAQQKVSELQGQITEARAEYQYLHDILTQTDYPLVNAVARALRAIGFQSVIDMDAEHQESKEEEPKREDLQVKDSSPLLLVEVKGVNGTPSDDEALQVLKYLFTRAKQLDRMDIRGLSIINHQKNLPALRRRDNPFNEDALNTAKANQIGLLTTWTLYKLVRSFLQLGWTHAQIAPLFYTDGYIEAVPCHYELLGEIEEFYAKAGAIVLTLEKGVRVGDRISYELSNEFIEEGIQSIHINDAPAPEAAAGVKVGLKTSFSKGQLKKHIRVFRVNSG